VCQTWTWTQGARGWPCAVLWQCRQRLCIRVWRHDSLRRWLQGPLYQGEGAHDEAKRTSANSRPMPSMAATSKRRRRPCNSQASHTHATRNPQAGRPAGGGQAILPSVCLSVLHPSPATCCVERAHAPCSANLARAKLAAALIATGCWLCWWDLSTRIE